MKHFVLIAPLFLFLSACSYMPGFGDPDTRDMAGPNYKPLTSEIAALAAPTGGGMQLYCTVSKGTARFQKGWLDFPDKAFILSENQRNNVELTAAKGTGLMEFQGIFDRAGQKLIFCPVTDGPPDQRIACASLYALDDDLRMGIKRTFDIPNAVMGGAIACAVSQAVLQKL